MLNLYNLLNPAPRPENYTDINEWAKAHRDWKCQKEGWTYGAFVQFTNKVRE